jgi:uncharacterized protein (DUF488 family)
MSQTLRPQVCHRAKLIAEALHERGIEVAHVDEAGSLVHHRRMLTSVVALQAGASSYSVARPS